MLNCKETYVPTFLSSWTSNKYNKRAKFHLISPKEGNNLKWLALFKELETQARGKLVEARVSSISGSIALTTFSIR